MFKLLYLCVDYNSKKNHSFAEVFKTKKEALEHSFSLCESDFSHAHLKNIKINEIGSTFDKIWNKETGNWEIEEKYTDIPSKVEITEIKL